MTIAEMKAEKSKMESTIAQAVYDFSTLTGLVVDRIGLDTINTHDGVIIDVKTEVKL